MDRVADFGARLGVDGVELVGERAELMGLQAPGATSAGGATRLLHCADDWIAASLARPDDRELVPAWLGLDAVDDDAWDVVASGVTTTAAGALVGRASLLGLPVARLGERDEALDLPTGATTSLDGVRVVDLSTLWAGPLVGRLLADLGADVVKIESAARPDGARRGNAEFFARLNDAKRSWVLDFVAERDELRRAVDRADVVVTSVRARALDQLGLGPSGQVWLAITGYGLTGPDATRVAFGDDAAVAGGLVAWEGDAPRFVGDAIADPLTGLVGAAAVLDALAGERPGLIDLAMADVAATFAPAVAP